ncbi:branched-chain amino acid ABC transporter permease [Cupriavidus cauae]|uniref:Branched-chain amino acid ABC transporter permease n=2 Tax=Cupriavidus TaxID=106589 RepID=A0A5M8A100_9BURK|nr:branched-chain amino acid ABC transporter permease [Cupriavidus cauae]KAA6117358.1 branched-chain amino acid ABC transporter permease [Cupriavidus cauae]
MNANRSRFPARGAHLLFAGGVLLLAAMPFLADNYFVRLATFVCMYGALALSWNFIGGYAGYPSFSTAAFVGLGSYVGGLLQNAGVPMVLAWLGATVFVSLFAALLGGAILRMKGHYFAIGSITLVEVLRMVASLWVDVTGGGDGLNIRILGGGPDFAGRVFLYAMLAVMLCAWATTLAVERSRLGFGLRCISQNEEAADMVGIDTNRYKTAAYTLSAVYCGTVGAIYASWVSYIAPTDAFGILLTLKVPVMAMLGGLGTVYGPLVGATAFVLMEETIWARFLDYHQAILGVVIVLLIFFLPGGLLKIDYRRGLARIRSAAWARAGRATATEVR